MPQQAELPTTEEIIEALENAAKKVENWFDVDASIEIFEAA